MEWTLGLVVLGLIVLLVALWHQTGKQRQVRGRGKQLVTTENFNRADQARLRQQGQQVQVDSKSALEVKKFHARVKLRQQGRQVQVDSKIALEVKKFYTRHSEEWINNAGKARLALAIDNMLGSVWPKNSNAARAQRLLAAAVLETVLARKIETVRQQQGAPQEGSQVGIVVDPAFAENLVATADVLAEGADHINDLDDVDDVDDFDTDDLDDIDDVDLDVDLEID